MQASRYRGKSRRKGSPVSLSLPTLWTTLESIVELTEKRASELEFRDQIKSDLLGEMLFLFQPSLQQADIRIFR